VQTDSDYDPQPQAGAAGAAQPPQAEDAADGVEQPPAAAEVVTGTVTVDATILQTVTGTSSVTV